MMGAPNLNYPANEPNVIDLGNRHFVVQLLGNGDRMAFAWWHDCPIERTWSWIGEMNGTASGHVILSVDPMTVSGSLLCPRGCRDHGFIENGAWVSA